MPARAQVLQFVRKYPGIHVREMERQLGLSSRLAAYHLEQLERDGEVQCVHETGYARYFPAVGRIKYAPGDVSFLCLMRRAIALRITLLLLARGELPQGEVARRLDIAKASASYHLGLLVQAGVAQCRGSGRQRFYSLTDPAYARGMLANFTPIAEDLDPFTALWNDVFR